MDWSFQGRCCSVPKALWLTNEFLEFRGLLAQGSGARARRSNTAICPHIRRGKRYPEMPDPLPFAPQLTSKISSVGPPAALIVQLGRRYRLIMPARGRRPHDADSSKGAVNSGLHHTGASNAGFRFGLALTLSRVLRLQRTSPRPPFHSVCLRLRLRKIDSEGAIGLAINQGPFAARRW
jgi:hypothetical protein